MTAETMDVDGRAVRVEVAGDAAATPVLLLHGSGRSLEDWDELTERLAGSHRVIRIDLPGFGYSAPAAGAIGLGPIAATIPKVLDLVGEVRPVHVCGNSLGGAVAMQLLADHPDRVRSTVLLNSAGFGATVTWQLRMLALPGLGWLATRRPTKSSVAMLEKSIFVDKSLATPERIARAVTLSTRPGAGDFMLAIVHALVTWRGMRPEWRDDLIGRVAPLGRPALVIWGDRDPIFPATHLEAARQALPHAQSHLFAQTGHMPQIERPDECADLIAGFIASVDEAGESKVS
ncbi:alpha/beta fold hydrolase [Nocardioides sp. GXZ039]|uniref:alpha/beta fold hydrolase n=1 Tax=Nocardioides sp. GXZ039 TaxID=3136018 RepID=UPI0030F399D9